MKCYGTVVGLSGTPLSALLHVDGIAVLNGTAGVGASERIHVPMNQRGIGFVQLLQLIYMYICIDFNVLWMKPHVSVLQPTIYLLQMSY